MTYTSDNTKVDSKVLVQSLGTNITIVSHIIQHLSDKESIKSILFVCKAWSRILDSNELVWMGLCFSRWPLLKLYNENNNDGETWRPSSAYSNVIKARHDDIIDKEIIKRREKSEDNIIQDLPRRRPNNSKEKEVYPYQISGYKLIRDQPCRPITWRQLFIARFKKESLLYLGNESTPVSEKFKLAKRFQLLYQIESLSREYYTELVNTEYDGNLDLLNLLESVLFSDIDLETRHTYDGCDEGMGMVQTCNIKGTLMNFKGQPLEFTIFIWYNIYGGHSDQYHHNETSHIRIGNVIFKLDKFSQPEPSSTAFALVLNGETVPKEFETVKGDELSYLEDSTIDCDESSLLITPDQARTFVQTLLPRDVFTNGYFHWEEW